ncbi:MAG: hypothetical protein A2W72_16175 [Burkholderiales bacterium RIFCSPLOWO2_12_67_14]|nr:MAG: hypothetical protein A3I64_01775 [Burkholderiales bacterium RIFCSPLOWO2_02_FULL_67_64]OGB38640.1 MAG: hypothetical protein A2W72_16175 [Burkholderiales bacterium RIFCSPLOWO2_12_67_14]OGB40313.1 MAG: hypothetical protein A3E51_26800 [Burkholderiales bacterium RIFCSPHIGHO2_12_FULL_67_38]OGB78807.1 MAG: hypothetical protein A3G82_09670 [Burkholderiales bacterium RIFCSPLOWO2_12_FULL_67_210]
MDFERELVRLVIWWGAMSLAGFIFSMWVLYLVIKSAIRDGINESRIADTWGRQVSAAKAREETTKMPPIRADR